ncbi:anti-sigma-D factor RsdA [Mycolicibacterium frederiksbergense]|uniref:anti-sigma-D factor RsdA n=1 Tax=Mycolicibacterium frederiksbergense TaxID=117567 RepID=UPI00399A39B2
MPDFGRWTANGGDPSLNDINRADKFLDALASEQPPFSTDRGDADLAFLLSGWRDEVRQVPMDHVVTPAEATAALVDATAGPSRRNRLSLAVVGSAAAAVLCLGGFGTAVFAAAPGDGLYGVRSMLFGDERATRDDAVVLAAQTELAQVQQLVDEGQWGQAQDKLAALSATVQSVDRVEQKQELIQQWNALTYKVVEQDPAATLPPAGEPLPEMPASPLTLLPMPVIEDSVTVTTTPGPEVLSTTGPSETTASETTTSVATTSETTGSQTSTSTSPVTETSTSPTSTSPTTTSPTTSAQTSTSETTTTQPSTTTTAPSSTTTTAPTTTTTTTVTTTAPTTTTATQSTSVAPPPRAGAPSSAPAVPPSTQAPVVQEAPVVEQPVLEEPVQTDEEPAVTVTTTTTPPSSGE